MACGGRRPWRRGPFLLLTLHVCTYSFVPEPDGGSLRGKNIPTREGLGFPVRGTWV